MPTYKPGPTIVPITQELKVETSRGDGIAIAVSYTGNDTVYLVVSKTDAGRPLWLSEQEIDVAYIGMRPGTVPFASRA